MHNYDTATETFDFLWNNYLTLAREVDLDAMNHDKLMKLVEENAQVRPYRIACWLTRSGFFISAWNLWEYYAMNTCVQLPKQVNRTAKESTVRWIERTMLANGKQFSDAAWFDNANVLRNLIAHNGARVSNDQKSKARFTKAKAAFPTLEHYTDNYLAIEHAHLCALKRKIEVFLRSAR